MEQVLVTTNPHQLRKGSIVNVCSGQNGQIVTKRVKVIYTSSETGVIVRDLKWHETLRLWAKARLFDITKWRRRYAQIRKTGR